MKLNTCFKIILFFGLLGAGASVGYFAKNAPAFESEFLALIMQKDWQENKETNSEGIDRAFNLASDLISSNYFRKIVLKDLDKKEDGKNFDLDEANWLKRLKVISYKKSKTLKVLSFSNNYEDVFKINKSIAENLQNELPKIINNENIEIKILNEPSNARNFNYFNLQDEALEGGLVGLVIGMLWVIFFSRSKKNNQVKLERIIDQNIGNLFQEKINQGNYSRQPEPTDFNSVAAIRERMKPAGAIPQSLPQRSTTPPLPAPYPVGPEKNYKLDNEVLKERLNRLINQ